MEVSKKRSHAEFEADQAQSANTGLGSTLALLKTPDLPTFGVGNRHKVNGENRAVDEAGWTTVSSNKKRKGKKVPKPDSSRYPAIAFSSSSNLQFQIQIQHLQDLVLYLLADGRSPQWISVQNRSAVRKVVVLMAPGLEKDMFTGDVLRQVTLGGETGNEKPPDSDEDKDENKDQGISKQHGSTAKTSVPHIDVQTYKTSPDFYLPVRLVEDSLPESLKPLAHIFRDLWPVRTPGDDRYHKMHSPIQRMLSLSVVKDKSDRTPADPATLRSSKEPRSQRVPVTELLCSLETLQEYEFVPHPAMFEDEHSRLEEAAHRQRQGQSIENGWMDTDVQDIKQGSVDESKIEQGSTTAGREIIAVDCEMCKTEDGELDLTRISLVDWDGEVILDELVKPTKTIIDYLTPFSGITKEKLETVGTTLEDIQQRLKVILHPKAILAGHSLDSDLTAMKTTHPFLIDTSISFPHPRGPPLKSSLKYLTQKHLGREIQKDHGAGGHDSVEDARACLDLVKFKCEKGMAWGTSENPMESIFKRLGRTNRPANQCASPTGNVSRSGAIVDWGQPEKAYGAGGKVCIACKTDEEVVQGVSTAANGDLEGSIVSGGGVDFVWARLRELEAVRGWWNGNRNVNDGERAIKMADQIHEQDQKSNGQTNQQSLTSAVADTVSHISQIYSRLPSCTAFIVYSGSGDPQEMSRLHSLQQQFKREYRTKKWDELSVQWTDVEEQALKAAALAARQGIGLIGIK